MPLSPADLDDVHAIQSDPGTWEHLPSGRPTDINSTRRVIEMSEASWSAHGFGLWTIRLPDGTVAGTCGAFVNALPVWNLGYRLSPAVWGHGLASEVAVAAVEAAQAADLTLPVVARVLSTNPASSRVAAKAGLTLRWRGRPTEGPKRLIHADRALEPELLRALAAL